MAVGAVIAPDQRFSVTPPHFQLPGIPGEVFGWAWIVARILIFAAAIVWIAAAAADGRRRSRQATRTDGGPCDGGRRRGRRGDPLPARTGRHRPVDRSLAGHPGDGAGRLRRLRAGRLPGAGGGWEGVPLFGGHRPGGDPLRRSPGWSRTPLSRGSVDRPADGHGHWLSWSPSPSSTRSRTGLGICSAVAPTAAHLPGCCGCWVGT